MKDMRWILLSNSDYPSLCCKLVESPPRPPNIDAERLTLVKKNSKCNKVSPIFFTSQPNQLTT